MKVLSCEYDFVVVGGGVAGTVAAIAAARLGVKTALVQNRPVLGGPSGSECCQNSDGAFITGAPEYVNRGAMETGILEEMRREAYYRSANGWQQHWSLVMREWAEREVNLTLLMNTEVHEVETEKHRIASLKARTLGSETEYVLKAPLFADCSGDSFVGFSAGAEYRMGREAQSEFGESLAPEKADKKTMGSSIAFRAVDMGRPVPFKAPEWAYKIHSDEDLPYRLHNNPKQGYWWLEYGGELDTIHDNEAIYQKLLSILFGMWDHVKNGGDHGAANYAINWISAIPAKRESRRLTGDYILTQNDIMNHPDFPDAVAYGGWPIDIHPPEGVFGKGHPGTTPPFIFPGVYSIPFRCLYSRNIENLLMAGRNISVTHVALGSTRVMATCALCGQAAGSAAALCMKYGCTPRELCGNRMRELQEVLYRHDQVLPWMPPMEEKIFSKISADSEMILKIESPDGELPLVPPDDVSGIYDPCNVPPADRRRGQMFPVATDHIDSIAVRFHNRSGRPATVKAVLYEPRIPGVFEGKELAAGECLLPVGEHVEGVFRFHVPVSCRSVFLLLEEVPGVFVCTRKRHLPGVYCKPDGCYFSNDNFCFSVLPEQYVFQPENVAETPPRPGLSSNLWISDPAQGLPQTLTLTCREPLTCSSVELVFDTNLDKKSPYGAAAECVKDYRLEVLHGNTWFTVAEVAGNYQRVRRHSFAPEKISAFRLTVLATNGDPSARLYNFRVFRQISG